MGTHGYSLDTKVCSLDIEGCGLNTGLQPGLHRFSGVLERRLPLVLVLRRDERELRDHLPLNDGPGHLQHIGSQPGCIGLQAWPPMDALATFSTASPAAFSLSCCSRSTSLSIFSRSTSRLLCGRALIWSMARCLYGQGQWNRQLWRRAQALKAAVGHPVARLPVRVSSHSEPPGVPRGGAGAEPGYYQERCLTCRAASELGMGACAAH